MCFALMAFAVFGTGVAYEKINLNVENDAKSPNKIKINDVQYEHVNETMLLVSAEIVITEKLTYGTKVNALLYD